MQRGTTPEEAGLGIESVAKANLEKIESNIEKERIGELVLDQATSLDEFRLENETDRNEDRDRVMKILCEHDETLLEKEYGPPSDMLQTLLTNLDRYISFQTNKLQDLQQESEVIESQLSKTTNNSDTDKYLIDRKEEFLRDKEEMEQSLVADIHRQTQVSSVNHILTDYEVNKINVLKKWEEHTVNSIGVLSVLVLED